MGETDIDEQSEVSMDSSIIITSCRSMPETTIQSKLSCLSKTNSFSHSDRFIPSRFAFNKSYDSFNICDTFHHSPLSIIRNQKNKKRKSIKHASPKNLDSSSNVPLGYKS